MSPNSGWKNILKKMCGFWGEGGNSVKVDKKNFLIFSDISLVRKSKLF